MQEKRPDNEYQVCSYRLVGIAGFEPATSRSRSVRTTNCAIFRFSRPLCRAKSIKYNKYKIVKNQFDLNLKLIRTIHFIILIIKVQIERKVRPLKWYNLLGIKKYVNKF